MKKAHQSGVGCRNRSEMKCNSLYVCDVGVDDLGKLRVYREHV